MKKDKLVSIIIPVYNVEKYIEECITSCLNQSYEEIEVIAIDDGSKDNSGKILDKITLKNKRLKVIHEKNSGVSATRNKGINEASGDYITFVDADDYLAPDAIKYMVEIIEKTNSEFGILKNCFTSSGQSQFENMIKEINIEDAIVLLLGLSMELGCWNKIYSKKMLIKNNIKFNEDLFYGEGLQFILNVAQNSKKIGLGTKAVYYYRKNNMASATTSFNYDKYINGEKSLQNVKDYLIKKSDKIDITWKFHYAMFAQNAMLACLNNKNHVNNYKKIYYEWKNKFNLYYKELIKSKYIIKKDKIKLFLIKKFPEIFIFIRNKKIKKTIKGSV